MNFCLNSNYPSLGITSSGVQERTGSKVLSQSANGISGQNRKADKVPGTGELLASGEELFFTPNLNVNAEGSLTQGDRLNLIKASRRAHQARPPPFQSVTSSSAMVTPVPATQRAITSSMCKTPAT